MVEKRGTARATLPWTGTPSVEGRPSFSRKKATDPGPKSGKLRSVASEASRTPPINFIPAAAWDPGGFHLRCAPSCVRSSPDFSGTSALWQVVLSSSRCAAVIIGSSI